MIHLDQQAGVARLTINRGSARNAFDLSGWRGLSGAVARIDAGNRVVLLSSADPGVFSAGADIGEITAQRLVSGWPERFLSEMRQAIDGIAALPMPVVATIDGGCFGAAVALALAADVRIAGPDARFAVTPAKLGLLYPATDVRRLIDAVGQGQALRLLLSGDSIDADEAARIGLVQMVAADARAEAEGFAMRIASNAPGAASGLKAIVRNPDDVTHDDAFVVALGGDELGRGLARFAARKVGR